MFPKKYYFPSLMYAMASRVNDVQIMKLYQNAEGWTCVIKDLGDEQEYLIQARPIKSEVEVKEKKILDFCCECKVDLNKHDCVTECHNSIYFK